MRVVGKRSVASFLKGLFNFIWYFALVVFSGALVYFTIHFFILGPTYQIHGWPIYVEPAVESFGIRPMDGHINIMEIQVEGAEIGFEVEGDWQPKAIRLFNLLIGAWLALQIVHHLRKITASVADGNPFIRDNVTRFRKAAVLFMAIAVFDAFRGIFITWYIRSRFIIDNPLNKLKPLDLGVFGDFLNSFDGGLIIIGLVLLVLGEIFRIGLEYKEDSHSIV